MLTYEIAFYTVMGTNLCEVAQNHQRALFFPIVVTPHSSDTGQPPAPKDPPMDNKNEW